MSAARERSEQGGASSMSEQCERTDERVAQYCSLYSWLSWTIVWGSLRFVGIWGKMDRERAWKFHERGVELLEIGSLRDRFFVSTTSKFLSSVYYFNLLAKNLQTRT